MNEGEEERGRKDFLGSQKPKFKSPFRNKNNLLRKVCRQDEPTFFRFLPTKAVFALTVFFGLHESMNGFVGRSGQKKQK